MCITLEMSMATVQLTAAWNPVNDHLSAVRSYSSDFVDSKESLCTNVDDSSLKCWEIFLFFFCIRKKVMSTKRESRIPLSCSCFYRNEKGNAGLENGEKYYAVVDSTMRECQSCKLSFTPSFYFAISLLSSVTKEVRLQCTSVSLSVCLDAFVLFVCGILQF